jgi:transposase
MKDATGGKIYAWPGHTDLRRSAKGLTVFVEETVGLEALRGGNMYAFCNKRRDLIKILWRDKNGFCLYQKRLAEDAFPWPEESDSTDEMGKEAVSLLAGSHFKPG